MGQKQPRSKSYDKMCRNRIKTLLSIFRITEGWKSREHFSLKCVLVIHKNTVDVECLLHAVNQAELLFMLHFTVFSGCFIPLLDGASVSLLRWLLALRVSLFLCFYFNDCLCKGLK